MVSIIVYPILIFVLLFCSLLVGSCEVEYLADGLAPSASIVSSTIVEIVDAACQLTDVDGKGLLRLVVRCADPVLIIIILPYMLVAYRNSVFNELNHICYNHILYPHASIIFPLSLASQDLCNLHII